MEVWLLVARYKEKHYVKLGRDSSVPNAVRPVFNFEDQIHTHAYKHGHTHPKHIVYLKVIMLINKSFDTLTLRCVQNLMRFGRHATKLDIT